MPQRVHNTCPFLFVQCAVSSGAVCSCWSWNCPTMEVLGCQFAVPKSTGRFRWENGAKSLKVCVMICLFSLLDGGFFFFFWRGSSIFNIGGQSGILEGICFDVGWCVCVWMSVTTTTVMILGVLIAVAAAADIAVFCCHPC